MTETTKIGYVNDNNQVVVKRTSLKGNDHGQFLYILACSECVYLYGANGSDIWERRCPQCQGGATGLPVFRGVLPVLAEA